MGILGFIAAILFLLFILWSRNVISLKTEKKIIENELKSMETDVLKELIENLNLNYELVEESTDCFVYKLVFQSEKGNIDVIVSLNKQSPYFVAIYSYFPMDVPKGKRLKVSEFFSYLNYGLSIGNFEMNMETGTLRTKVSYCYDYSGNQQADLFNSYLKHSYNLLEHYFDGIMTVIYSEKTSKKVYEELTNQVDVSMN
jgi:hypothetical protein